MPDNLGASCDWFLHSEPQLLTEVQWIALQKQWIVTECTSVKNFGYVKGDIEKLCSVAPCDEKVTKAVNSGINRIQNLK